MNQRTRRAGHPSKANPHPTRLVVTPDFRLRPTIVGLAFVAMAATAPALHAQTTSSGSVVGASGGGADLTIGDAPGSTGAMSVRNAEFYAGYLQVGVSGTGQLDIGDGTYFRVANTSVVGVNREGRGTVTVEGQNAWLAEDDSMYVGNAGSGSVVVSNGGRLSLDRSPSTDPDLNIGVQAGAPGGSVTVTGKAQSADASRLSVDNDAQVGVAGTGRLEVSDGAQASVSRNVTVGTDAGSDGTLVVSRQSATLGVGSTTTIGDSGTGRASVIDGGRLTTSDLRIGAREGADGEVTVSSPGSSLSASGSLVVGGQGVGRLSVLGGSPVEAANVYVGESAGSVGNVLVSERNDGLRSRLTTDGQLSVAVSGKGTMVVSRGGQADARQGIVVGNAVGSVGELTVTGSGSRIGTEGDLRIGKSGTASLSVDGGGRVTAAGNASLGIDAGSRSFVSVDGSGSALSVGGKLSIGESGIGEMRVGGGGAVGASSVSLGNDPGGAGGNGSGAVTVDGAGSTLTVNGNTVVGDAGRGSIVVSDGGTLTMQGGRLQIGERVGSLGGVTVTGENSTLGLDRGIRVGDRGTGLLEVSDSAQVATSSDMQVGVEQGSTGTLIVTGPVSRLAVDSTTVGYEGTGSATVSAGGTLATLDMRVGFRDTGSGTVTVDGENSLLAVQGPLAVGQDGKASLLVANGARATVGEDAVVGVNRGGGAITVTGAKSRLTVATDLVVGQEASGELSVLDGAQVDAQYVSVGQVAGGAGAVKVAGTGSRLTLDFLTVADAGTGTVEVSGGGGLSVASTELSTVIGARAGVRGSVLVTGAGSTFGTATDIQVGESGTGSMRVADGAQAFVGRNASVGTNVGADGTVAVTGAASALSVQGSTLVGDSGTGQASMSQGGTLTTTYLTIGSRAAGKGDVTASDAGSRLSVASNLLVGDSGAGKLSILAGASAEAGNVYIGQNKGSIGTVRVDGRSLDLSSRSTLTSNQSIFVGDSGNGAMAVSDGGQASAKANVIVANETGGVSELTVTGADSMLVAARQMHVGNYGTGSMRVADGARAAVGLDASVGTNAGADGTLAVTGAASALSVQGTTLVGDSGTGRVTLGTGGDLTTGALTLGNTGDGRGNVTVEGAGSALSASGRMVVGGAGIGALSVLDGARADARLVSVGRDAGGSGRVEVAGTGSRLALDTLTVADGGAGTVDVSGGGGLSASSTGVSMVIGAGPGIQGGMFVTGAGSTLAAAGEIDVGQSGTGVLGVSDGGQAFVGTSAMVGREAGSAGTLTIAGTSSKLSVGGATTVGNAGTAIASLRDGATLATGDLIVGNLASGAGTLTVDGGGSALEVVRTLQVGAQGSQASLAVSGGARALVGTSAVIGAHGPGAGAITVTGTGSGLGVADEVVVGQAASGDLAVLDGGEVRAASLRIGADATGAGTVRVGGAASSLAAAGALRIGSSGNGVLTVSDGARATSAVTYLGQNAGGTATVRLTGAGSTLSTGDVHMGRNDASDASNPNGGISSLTVADGATLHAASGLRYDADAPATGQPPASTTSTGTLYVATSAGSTATLNVGADAGSAAATAGTIDARRIVFGQGKGFLVFNHTAQDLGFTPTIEGAGRVQVLSGTTTLASGSTYSGGTSITGATLKGSATSFGYGAIRNDGALVIDQASDAALANAMAGTGALTKAGAGLLNVTGDSSGFTGATTIAAGRMAVNGSLARSVVTAQAGTTLSGAGTVGGVLARDGSTIAPGNSPGTLTVTGDYRQASGATYAAEVVPGGTVSDLVAVGGTATLERGAVIRVAKYGTGGYAPGTRYTVLSAAGGVNGTYVLTGETDVSAFYSLRTTYDANHVYLDTVQARPFVAAAGTLNQTAAASGVQDLPLAKALPTAIGSLRTEEDARRAFDQLSGELHASARTVLLDDSRFVREATRRQVHAVSEAKGSGESVWAQVYGASGRYDGDGNAAGLQRDIGGLFVGTDATVAGGTRLGIVGGYGRSRIELKEGRGSATVDTHGLGLYGATQWDRTRASFGANAAWHKLSTTRSVGLEGFADTLTANDHARTTQLYGDIGYRMGADLALAPAALEPFASLAWVDLHTPGVQEKGGTAALAVAGGSMQAGFATLGARSAATLDIGGVPVVASGLLGWRSVLGGTTPSSTNHLAGAAGFVVQGVPLARNVAAVEANVSAALTPTLTLGLSYSGQIGSGVSDHGVKASLSMKF